MKIAVCSDLHIDDRMREIPRLRQELVQSGVSTLISCGDLARSGTHKDRLYRLCPPNVRAMFVHGNHEPYGTSFEDLAKVEYKAQHIYLPETGAVALTDRTVVVGTDGWYGCVTGASMSRSVRSDARAIKEFDEVPEDLLPHVMREKSRESLEIIPLVKSLLAAKRHVILVTHVPPVDIGENLDGFCNDLLGEELMKLDHTGNLWVFCGHVHPGALVTKMLNGIKVHVLPQRQILYFEVP